MTRRLALALGLLASCRTVSADRSDAASLPSAAASAAAAPADAALAAKVEAPEPPLAWGTRPAKEGPLYPVVDGMCMRAEIWLAGTTAIFGYGGALARFTDDGLATLEDERDASGKSWSHEDIHRLDGRWPGPLVFHGRGGGGRERWYEDVWLRDGAAWTRMASHKEKGEPSYPDAVLHHGWVVTARTPMSYGEAAAAPLPSLVVTYPAEKGAAPIPGVTQLGRAGFVIEELHASDSTLYAVGRTSYLGTFGRLVRWVEGGKAGEATLPNDDAPRVVAVTSTALYVMPTAWNVPGSTQLYRVRGGKLKLLPTKGARVIGVSVAPNGDPWLLTTKDTVLVMHDDVIVSEKALPAPKGAGPAEKVTHSAITGARLVGVDLEEPYAVSSSGSLYRYADDGWQEVPLPSSPFATTGTYKAQSLYLPARGDLYVNAAYVEKGVGWKVTAGYRAILRAKRPREVLRCNEPFEEVTGTSRGMASFPPLATEACATPFAILLRVAFDVDTKEPKYVFDKASDYPAVRAAIKATPGLGGSVELVEVVSGGQRYLGAKVPTLAAGQALARAVGDKVKVDFHATKPEIVCGVPKAERSLKIDVATGDVTP